MKLPRYTATTPPPRSSGQVRAENIGALVRSSDIEKWKAVEGIGQAFQYGSELSFQASQKRQALDDEIEAGKVTQKVLDKFSLARDAASRFDATADQPLPGDPNFDKVITTFDTTRRDLVTQDLLKGVDKDASNIFSGIKSPRVKARLVNWYNASYRNEADGIRKVVRGKLDEYQTTEITKLMESAAKNGNTKTADYYASLMDQNELITHERAEAYKKENKVIADTSMVTAAAQLILDGIGKDAAVDFVMTRDIDTDIKRGIVSDIEFESNRALRQQATELKQLREKTYTTMLADLWEQKPITEHEITEALRTGALDVEDAKYLRKALLSPEPPETTNEALIAVRYAIDGIGVTETRESALKKVIAYTEQLSPTDGKAFIKEIFSEHDTKNAFWNGEAFKYMEKQILEIVNESDILYGSGEQLALSASAFISYDLAKKDAVEKGKPLSGSELLELAHQTMLPFRNKVKSLIEGEKIPETLAGRKVGVTGLPETTKPAPKKKIAKRADFDSYPTPETEKSFNDTITHIPSKDMKILYFETMIKRIKDDALVEKLYKKWVTDTDELYK